METRKNTSSVERRAVGEKMEIRATVDGKSTIRGYALKWNSRYNMGWFTEEIHRDALKNADLSDVRALLNHDPNFVLGRSSAGTLRLEQDETGLLYEIDLPSTQAARDLTESIKRGDISQSSWGFTLRTDDQSNGDEWERNDGKDHRVIKSVRQVWDVSAVTFPANPDTSVAKRSIEAQTQASEEIQKQKTLTRRKKQIRSLLALNPNK
jgi:hypothetical protein